MLGITKANWMESYLSYLVKSYKFCNQDTTGNMSVGV